MPCVAFHCHFWFNQESGMFCVKAHCTAFSWQDQLWDSKKNYQNIDQTPNPKLRDTRQSMHLIRQERWQPKPNRVIRRLQKESSSLIQKTRLCHKVFVDHAMIALRIEGFAMLELIDYACWWNQQDLFCSSGLELSCWPAPPSNQAVRGEVGRSARTVFEDDAREQWQRRRRCEQPYAIHRFLCSRPPPRLIAALRFWPCAACHRKSVRPLHLNAFFSCTSCSQQTYASNHLPPPSCFSGASQPRHRFNLIHPSFHFHFSVHRSR